MIAPAGDSYNSSVLSRFQADLILIVVFVFHDYYISALSHETEPAALSSNKHAFSSYKNNDESVGNVLYIHFIKS